MQAIIRALGGAINRRVPGQETTFQVVLPCSAEVAERDVSATPPALDGRVPGFAGTVLLVENEETLRVAVSLMLRKKSFSVIEAGDGCAALDLFRDRKDSIDVVLLDMTIPGTSSREIIAEARRIRPDVKILLASAYSREMVMPSLDTPQIKGFIRKPFRVAEILQLIRDTVSS